METQAKFADTIYSRDAAGLYVNLFVPSEVTWPDGGADDPAGHRLPGRARAPSLTVVSGTARLALRVRIPSWVAGGARAWLNGRAGRARGAGKLAGRRPHLAPR